MNVFSLCDNTQSLPVTGIFQRYYTYTKSWCFSFVYSNNEKCIFLTTLPHNVIDEYIIVLAGNKKYIMVPPNLSAFSKILGLETNKQNLQNIKSETVSIKHGLNIDHYEQRNKSIAFYKILWISWKIWKIIHIRSITAQKAINIPQLLSTSCYFSIFFSIFINMILLCWHCKKYRNI